VFDVLAQEIPTVTVVKDNGLALADAIVQAGLAKSKSEARRAIEQGGVYVNQQRADVAKTLGGDDWIGGRNVLLRKGKKEYALLRAG
jgi:tyrosyl-tRNA synthetase